METNYAEELGVCRFCGEKNVRNPKTGKIFCQAKCWLKRSNQPAQPYTPEQGRTVEIKQAQENKQGGIRLSSSGRDATLVVTTFYPELSIAGGSVSREELIQQKIKEWRKFFYDKIYADDPTL